MNRGVECFQRLNKIVGLAKEGKEGHKAGCPKGSAKASQKVQILEDAVPDISSDR